MIGELVAALFGPLVGIECARASRRGWVIWGRMVPAVVSAFVGLVAYTVWVLARNFDPAHLPYAEVRTGLLVVEGILVAAALILTPATLAGTLAGEKERGSIGLLLTTRARPSDIVLGRLIARLAQVVLFELAAVPMLVLLGSLAGLGPRPWLALLALPIGLAFGVGGVALGASALSRRGRDALLLVYLMIALVLLAPLARSVGVAWVAPLNPFDGLNALCWSDDPRVAATSAAIWIAIGAGGLMIAATRLRAVSLRDGDDARRRGRRTRRGLGIPAVGNRPMVWKELYIERAGALGRAGRWLAAALIFALVGGSLAVLGRIGWATFVRPDPAAVDATVNWASMALGNTAWSLGVLIQLAIALRAAVTVASERERGTWDGLMTSPLEGREIILGKLGGSLHSLRWLIVATVLAWSVAWGIGAMEPGEYARHLIGLATIGTFAAALGVWASLRSATATRAMALTVGCWFLAHLAIIMVAFVICSAVAIACVFGWLAAMQAGLVDPSGRPWFPMPFGRGMELLYYGQFAAGVALLVAVTRLRFDRLAGRMTAGKAALAVDLWVHGRPMPAVHLGGMKPATKAPSEVAI